MEILEFGDSAAKKLVLIHGFQCPYTVLSKYIEYYKKDFHIIVPVLPGHNPQRKEEFISLEDSVQEFLDYYIGKYGHEIYAVYGMSFGGVFACEIWKNENISIEKLIIESSPLLPFRKQIISFMTKWYLKMAGKVKAGHKGTLLKATKSIVPYEYLDDFKTVVSNMSDESINNYVSQVGRYSLSSELLANRYSDNAFTKIYYFYGGKFTEVLFKRVGRFLRRFYKSAYVRVLKGKGHCEDSLLHSDQWIFTLNQIL